MESGNTQWITHTQALEALGIRPRTLTLWCSQGKVERRQVGRRALYRPVAPTISATAATEPRHRGNVGIQKGAIGNVGNLALVASIPATGTRPETGIEPQLLALVNHLTTELQQAQAQRSEAIGIGFMLADEREALIAKVRQLEAVLRSVVASPRSIGIRSTLLAVLGQQ